MKFKKHLFICTYQRENGESCSQKGANDLVTDLKNWIKNEKLTDYKITRSGCLGFCEKGIASVCYPKGNWSFDLQTDSIELIKNQLKNEG